MTQKEAIRLTFNFPLAVCPQKDFFMENPICRFFFKGYGCIFCRKEHCFIANKNGCFTVVLNEDGEEMFIGITKALRRSETAPKLNYKRLISEINKRKEG